METNIQAKYMNVRLLLSTQRSGSHFVKSFIETHFPAAICTPEILGKPLETAEQHVTLLTHPEIPHFWPWYEAEAAAGNISVAPDKRMAAFESYLSKLTTIVQPRNPVIDVKYNTIRTLSGYWDTDQGSNDFTTFIISRNIPVLHLIRKNILRVIVSNKLAEHTGIWHRVRERSPEEVLPKIRLYPKGVLFEIRSAFKLTQDYQNRFGGYPGYDEIIYEDFVQEQSDREPGINLRTVARFLNEVPVAANEALLPFKKTTPNDPSEVVENWQEVVRIVRTTEHGWMTETPLLVAA